MSNKDASAIGRTQENALKSDHASRFCAVILAGQRPGIDPVASTYGFQAKALVPVLGVPMIDRVLRVLLASDRIDRVIIVGDSSLEPLTQASGVAAAIASSRACITEAESTISGSVEKALRQAPSGQNCFVTTADNVLLSPETLEHFLDGAIQCDLAVGMVARERIEARYPGIPRTYYRFADSAVSGANLFAFTGPSAGHAVEFWKVIEASRKKPLRVFAAFGFWNLIGGALRLFSLAKTFERASERIGCHILPILLPDAEAAIDVDKVIDFVIAEGILAHAALPAKKKP